VVLFVGKCLLVGMLEYLVVKVVEFLFLCLFVDCYVSDGVFVNVICLGFMKLELWMVEGGFFD